MMTGAPHPRLHEFAQELEALFLSERLDRESFGDVIARAKAAGISHNECHPLYQFGSHHGVANLSAEFPASGRCVFVSYKNS